MRSDFDIRPKFSKGSMPARNKKNFRPTKSGAGMTQAGVKAYRRMNPGSKLKTAVTGKVKPGSKAVPGCGDLNAFGVLQSFCTCSVKYSYSLMF